MASTLNKKFELMGIHVGDGCISVNERYSEYAREIKIVYIQL